VINLRLIRWSDKAHKKLKVALMGDDQILKHEVDKGVSSMRIHSHQKGMERLLRPAGFAPVETIFKAEI
jgi:hypothetical protein